MQKVGGGGGSRFHSIEHRVQRWVYCEVARTQRRGHTIARALSNGGAAR